MKEKLKKEWRSLFVNDILKEHPGAIHLFDSYRNIQCVDSPITVEDFCKEYQVPINELELVLNEMLEISYVEMIGASDWELDFLVDFLLNIHHTYIKKQVPFLLNKIELILLYSNDHSIKVLYQILTRAQNELIKTLEQTETAVFPYIKQIARAYKFKESYGELLVSTLRKPIAQQLSTEIAMMQEIISGIRVQSNYYCFDHSKVDFRSISVHLKTFDFQLQRHIQLKEEVLLPKSLDIELALHKS